MVCFLIKILYKIQYYIYRKGDFYDSIKDIGNKKFYGETISEK